MSAEKGSENCDTNYWASRIFLGGLGGAVGAVEREAGRRGGGKVGGHHREENEGVCRHLAVHSG